MLMKKWEDVFFLPFVWWVISSTEIWCVKLHWRHHATDYKFCSCPCHVQKVRKLNNNTTTTTTIDCTLFSLSVVALWTLSEYNAYDIWINASTNNKITVLEQYFYINAANIVHIKRPPSLIVEISNSSNINCNRIIFRTMNVLSIHIIIVSLVTLLQGTQGEWGNIYSHRRELGANAKWKS